MVLFLRGGCSLADFKSYWQALAEWLEKLLYFLGFIDEDCMSRRKKHRRHVKFHKNLCGRTDVRSPEVFSVANSSHESAQRVAQENMPSPTAIIYQSEMDYISRCILDYKNIETGGQLFGFWTATGIPVILYAIGPGRKANHQQTFFNQDLNYLLKVGNHILSKYGLQHIGEWHSHHQLGLARPSGHDDTTMVNNIRKEHLRRFLLCIGNCTNTCSTLNAFSFHEDHGYNYVQARWSIKEGESPFRKVIDKDLAGILIHPRTQIPHHGQLFLEEPAEETKVVEAFNGDYWLSSAENKKVLVEINKFLKSQKDVDKVMVQVDNTNSHLHITIQKGSSQEKLYFPADFPRTPVEISVNGVIRRRNWKYSGNILQSFTRYYNEVVKHD